MVISPKRKMLVLLTIIISILTVKASLPDDCEALPIDKNADSHEKPCMGMWYVYASSKECNDCCLIRNLTQINSRLLKVKHFTKIGRESPKFEMVYGKRELKSETYKHDSDRSTVKIVGLDCKKYIVVLKEDVLYLYTREKDPGSNFINSIDGLNKCKFQPDKLYNPKETCANVTANFSMM